MVIQEVLRCVLGPVLNAENSAPSAESDATGGSDCGGFDQHGSGQGGDLASSGETSACDAESDEPDSPSRTFYARCADGHNRRCYATVAAWMADYPEHRDLHNVVNGTCFWCECPQNELGNLPHRRSDRYPLRDHNLYHMLSDANTAQSKAELVRRKVNPGFNILHYLDCVTSDLPKADLLHTMQIGMLKHLLDWLFEFLKLHKRLERFNSLWLSVPAYLDMSKPRRAYEEVSRWNGGEIKNMTRFLVAVLRNALRNPSASQRTVFDRAIECSRALVEFYFYCQYDSHDNETLNLMDNALRRFHDSKDVFLQFRAGKKLTAEGKAMRKELCEERDAELTANNLKSATVRQRIRNSWKDILLDEMQTYAEEGSDFNFPKIHLMMHFREQIQRYGSLRQWSTEIGESSQKNQIKDGFNASNKTGDYYTQMINYYLRCDAFAVRKMNRDAWSRKQTPGSTPLPSTTTSDTATSAVSPTSNAIRRPHLTFISPQQYKGQNKVTTFRSLLDGIADRDERDDFHNATHRFLRARNINIADDDLLSCAAAIFHGLEVEARDMHGRAVLQRLRCTADRTWYSGPARHDWAWLQMVQCREGQELPYKALRGRLPSRMRRLFKLHVKHAGGHSMLWLVYGQLLKAANGGMPEPASQLVRMVKPQRGGSYSVISAGNVRGAAHLIPEEPISSKQENQGWIVNSHIDLATWNEVYYMLEEELDRARRRV